MKYISLIFIAALGAASCSSDHKKALDAGSADGSVQQPDGPATLAGDTRIVDVNTAVVDVAPDSGKDGSVDVSSDGSSIPLDPNPVIMPTRDGSSDNVARDGLAMDVSFTSPDASGEDSKSPEYKDNSATVDGGIGTCDPKLYWVFVEANARYCGAIGDACQFACGTTFGCKVDVETIGTATFQTVYCPK